eukprot:CAMPEP_0201602342 /NCGR_PEP_ID=MMETSP0492-20130828/3107_1 /ASSEMBLY_ACC=CAM_ASM_000837 /TAXON_ID=420259 /ORGANISM="Thalassiosira gravida, Strain GMp14c1" /LENGTH=42 /DNA_ID= /DNA_START= /DNA_END= /DNA_ORIENTATION=
MIALAEEAVRASFQVTVAAGCHVDGVEVVAVAPIFSAGAGLV